MGTISGNFYKVCYMIVTAGPLTNPPSVVGPLSFALVNAATQQAAVTALIADLSLGTGQSLVVVTIQQLDTFANTAYQ
jgi:hypothetical protein